MYEYGNVEEKGVLGILNIKFIFAKQKIGGCVKRFKGYN